MSAPPQIPCVTAGVTDRPACACGQPILTARADAQHCPARCPQRAYRARRVQTTVGATTRTPRAQTIYECPTCSERRLGEQRCEDCGAFSRRIGPGGACPHCDEPVLVTDLVDLPE